jgi:hypothetical protein
MRKLTTELPARCFINQSRPFIHSSSPLRRRSPDRRGWDSSSRGKDKIANDRNRIAPKHWDFEFDAPDEEVLAKAIVESSIAHASASPQTKG